MNLANHLHSADSYKGSWSRSLHKCVICRGTAKTGLFRQFFVNISKAFKAVFMAKPSSHNVLEWPEFEHIVLGDLDKGCPPPRQGAACGLSVLLPPQIHLVSASLDL